MSNPNTRSEFKDYCLRRLGFPVIEINVDDDQIEDRIDDALQYWQDYHFDGLQKVYYIKKILQTDINQKYIDLSNSKDASNTAGKTISQIQQKMLTPPSAPKIDPSTTIFNPDKIRALAKNLQNEDISEDIYESRLYKMKLAGYFD